jgi:hypothetical protein
MPNRRRNQITMASASASVLINLFRRVMRHHTGRFGRSTRFDEVALGGDDALIQPIHEIALSPSDAARR